MLTFLEGPADVDAPAPVLPLNADADMKEKWKKGMQTRNCKRTGMQIAIRRAAHASAKYNWPTR